MSTYEGRPATGRPSEQATTLFDLDSIRPRPQIAEEWDRRRAFERRTAPIPKRRSSSDDLARVVWVEVGPRNSTAISGDRIIPAIKKFGIPYQWHPHRRDVLLIPSDHADDLITYFEHRCRRRVEVVEVDRI